MQEQLFSHHFHQTIQLDNGALDYFPNWLPENLAWSYFNYLQKFCVWQQSTIQLAGRSVKIPRLNAWYGDADAYYRYSGTDFSPLRWNHALLALRRRLEKHFSQNNLPGFNSALINYYRDGNDSVSWHADDEPELGPSPVIASLSFGATRRFLLKPKRGGDSLKLDLEHGSLLIMQPPLQKNWLHCLPKTKRLINSRINVTFRQVVVRNNRN